MPYFLDDLIEKIAIACLVATSDPHKARSFILDIKEKESPIDEEIKYLIDKMIFISLDSPKKFKQIGSDLIKLLTEKDKKLNKNDKKSK